MSKYSAKELWNKTFGAKEKVYDYAGRLIMKSACGNPTSHYHPTIDHIRPIADGGKDTIENIVICHDATNKEKADHFPHWTANGLRFHAKRKTGIPNGYSIISEERKS